MNGRQLKQYASTVHDDAVIEMRERNYENWQAGFSIRATLTKLYDWQLKEQEEEAARQVPLLKIDVPNIATEPVECLISRTL